MDLIKRQAFVIEKSIVKCISRMDYYDSDSDKLIEILYKKINVLRSKKNLIESLIDNITKFRNIEECDAFYEFAISCFRSGNSFRFFSEDLLIECEISFSHCAVWCPAKYQDCFFDANLVTDESQKWYKKNFDRPSEIRESVLNYIRRDIDPTLNRPSFWNPDEMDYKSYMVGDEFVNKPKESDLYRGIYKVLFEELNDHRILYRR